MQLIHPGPEEALLCLRAVRTTVARQGVVPPAARALIGAAQQSILNTNVDIDALAPIGAPELAAGLTTPGLAEQVVQAMLIGILADGEPDPACEARADGFAAALGVAAPALRTVRLLCEHHMLLFRLDFLRRSHFKDMFIDQFRHHGGLSGLAKGVLGLRGLYRDPELAARYDALGALPSDTLGYAYFHHIRDNGFGFAGESNGLPEGAVYHDMTHVLSGYDTTPAGETCVGGFTAGFKQVNPFYVLLVPALTFGAGVNITPADQPTITGILGEPGVARRFIEAVERGARVNTDLSANWDYWPFLPLPIGEARSRLGIG